MTPYRIESLGLRAPNGSNVSDAAAEIGDFALPRVADAPRRPACGPHKLSPRVFADLVRAFDLMLIAGSGRIGLALFAAANGNAAPTSGEWLGTLVGSYICVALLAQGGVYRVRALRTLILQLACFAIALPAGAAGNYACEALLESRFPSSVTALCWAFASGAVWVIAHTALTRLVDGLVLRERLIHRTAIVGVNEVAHRLAEEIAGDSKGATRLVGVYDHRPPELQTPYPSLPVTGNCAKLLEDSRYTMIDSIVVALPFQDLDRAKLIAEQFARTIADIYLVTDLDEIAGTERRQLVRNSAVLIAARPLKDWQVLQKLTFDYVLASLLLVLLSPVMVIAAAAIKLDSPGPILFRQPRIGFNNRTFDIYKFRTMHHHAADLLADRQTTPDDPRVTKVGRWLRKFSIDEFPQLINVLRGEMSLVGPRPHAPNTKAGGRLFDDAVASYPRRYRVKPGITGWAQVNRCRGQTKSVAQLENRVAYDLYYIENWSLLLDIKIIVLTALREICSDLAF